MRIKLKLPLPDSLNRYLNKCWQARGREKDGMAELVYLLLCEKLGCPLPKLCKAKLVYTVHSDRQRDADNLIVVVKLFNDAIVRAGLVADDDAEHLTYNLPGFIYDKERYVEVKIIGRKERQ